MTREDLERAVLRELPLGSMTRADAGRTADAVIRLVVEACCADLLADANDLRLHSGHRASAFNLALRLRTTFLPTTEPTDG